MSDREITRLLQQTGAVQQGTFRLRNGGYSNYFIDSRRLTLNPKGARCQAEAMLRIISADYPVANTIVGVAHGAVPIVAQLCLLSELRGQPLNACFIAPKGEKAWQIIPPLPKDKSILAVIIEDVVATGKSALDIAAALLRNHPAAEIMAIVALADRNEGGRENIINVGCQFQAVIPDMKDLLKKRR